MRRCNGATFKVFEHLVEALLPSIVGTSLFQCSENIGWAITITCNRVNITAISKQAAVVCAILRVVTSIKDVRVSVLRGHHTAHAEQCICAVVASTTVGARDAGTIRIHNRNQHIVEIHAIQYRCLLCR